VRYRKDFPVHQKRPPTGMLLAHAHETAWVAGLLEGEGCFILRADRLRSNLAISCEMTDRDIVYRLREITGVGNVGGPYYTRQFLTHKPKWRWTVTRRGHVVELCTALLPWMGERRGAKIQEMLDWNVANPVRGARV
jgi:hypothetical protein